MIDMLQNAKDLIAKGKALNDPELIQMGTELLEQYQPKVEEPVVKEVQEPYYICENCGHTMPVDKKGRKRCPECKKHKLRIENPVVQPEPTSEELLEALENQQLQPNPNNTEQFHMQIRNVKHNGRIHYDENGNPDGLIRKREPVDPSKIHNEWQDTGEDADDPTNELLKKFTKVSPRTRKPPKKVKVECDSCHKTEYVHPIHAGGRGQYLCQKCIRRRSQF